MEARSRSVELPAALASVPVARHFVRDLLLEWNLAAAVDDASLAVTELVANAVKHARSPVGVSVLVDQDILVSVRDQTCALPRRRSAPEPLAENGRGLRIVAAVSSDWGITTERNGKCLWFRLPVPDAAAHDADIISILSTTSTGARQMSRAASLGAGSAGVGTASAATGGYGSLRVVGEGALRRRKTA